MCLSAWAEGDSPMFAATRVFPRTPSHPRRETWDSSLEPGTLAQVLPSILRKDTNREPIPVQIHSHGASHTVTSTRVDEKPTWSSRALRQSPNSYPWSPFGPHGGGSATSLTNSLYAVHASTNRYSL